jgi:hypothetical protein
MKKGFCLLLVSLPLGCGGNLKDIDRRVDVLMFSTSTKMGAVQPEVWVGSGEFTTASLTNEEPPTVNPPAELLGFVPAIKLDENEIAKSLDRAADDLASSGEVLSLEEVLVWASEHAKEMQFAQYDYLSSTLSLLSELH